MTITFLLLPLMPRGHALSLYEERAQRRTKEKNPRFPSLEPPLLRLFVRKKGNAAALLRPNQSVDCKRFCFAKANQENLYDPLVYIFSMKSRAEQERLLSILQEIDKYKET